MVKRLSDLYAQTRRALLEQESPQDASLIARDLICTAAKLRREELLTHGERYVAEDVCDTVAGSLRRILAGEPLAYVLGQWEFYGLPLYVDKNVLIPRDDTCAVTAMAIRQALFLDKGPRILDLCTGSGCIGLAIAAHVPDARVTLADVSREALAVAKRNILLNKCTGRVSCVQVNALEEPAAFLGQFHLIVSNPPYVTGREMEELPGSVRDHEPELALYGGSDGLDFYRSITANFKNILRPGGYLCYEFGMGQGDAVVKILEDNGFTVLERARDFNDRERAVLARYDRKEEI